MRDRTKSQPVDRRRTLCRAALFGLVASAWSGCASTNEQVGLIGSDHLPSLNQPAPGGLSDDSPSLTGLDRSGWPRVVVIVPDRQVEHRPTYVTEFRPGNGQRAEGAWPTHQSALAEESRHGLADVNDEAVAVGLSAFDLAASPVRAILRPPWMVERSSSVRFDRAPHHELYDTTQWWRVESGAPELE